MESTGVHLTWSDCYVQIFNTLMSKEKSFDKGLSNKRKRINPRNKSHISPTSSSMDRLPSILVLNINISVIL